MKTIFSTRIFAIVMCTFATSFAFGQDYADKIKAKWMVVKFDVEKSTSQSINVQQEIVGTYLTFGEELLISKKMEAVETVIKKGPYLVSGNALSLGKDNAEIVELSENKMTIKIAGQGVLYLSKI